MIPKNQKTNLLVRLRKWVHRQDENFLTEAFSHLLEHLLCHESEVASRVMKTLRVEINPADTTEVTIKTQVKTPSGIPDLEIRLIPSILAYLEIKIEAAERLGQLRRYLNALAAEKGVTKTALILLTRDQVEVPAEIDVHHVFWHEVADSLERAFSEGLRHQDSRYLIQQFTGFLRARNMTMDRVGPDLICGVHGLMSLRAMLEEAARANNIRPKHCGLKTVERTGYYLEGVNYFLGLYYEQPHLVVFFTRAKICDRARAQQVGYGQVKGTGDPCDWQHNFDLEQEQFFTLSLPDQLSKLTAFVKECLRGADAACSSSHR